MRWLDKQTRLTHRFLWFLFLTLSSVDTSLNLWIGYFANCHGNSGFELVKDGVRGNCLPLCGYSFHLGLWELVIFGFGMVDWQSVEAMSDLSMLPPHPPTDGMQDLIWIFLRVWVEERPRWSNPWIKPASSFHTMGICASNRQCGSRWDGRSLDWSGIFFMFT